MENILDDAKVEESKNQAIQILSNLNKAGIPQEIILNDSIHDEILSFLDPHYFFSKTWTIIKNLMSANNENNPEAAEVIGQVKQALLQLWNKPPLQLLQQAFPQDNLTLDQVRRILFVPTEKDIATYHMRMLDRADTLRGKGVSDSKTLEEDQKNLRITGLAMLYHVHSFIPSRLKQFIRAGALSLISDALDGDVEVIKFWCISILMRVTDHEAFDWFSEAVPLPNLDLRRELANLLYTPFLMRLFNFMVSDFAFPCLEMIAFYMSFIRRYYPRRDDKIPLDYGGTKMMDKLQDWLELANSEGRSNDEKQMLTTLVQDFGRFQFCEPSLVPADLSHLLGPNAMCIDICTEYKKKGNKAFGAKDWKAAIDNYTLAIKFSESQHDGSVDGKARAVYFSNRAASLLNKGKHVQAALQDARQAIRANPNYAKAHFRCASAMHQLRQHKKALEHVARAEELGMSGQPALSTLKERINHHIASAEELKKNELKDKTTFNPETNSFKIDGLKGEFEDHEHVRHKVVFDRICHKYGFRDDDKKAGELADLLTAANEGKTISAESLAEKYGMEISEAVAFLEWISVGIQFKEESIDNAKKIKGAQNQDK